MADGLAFGNFEDYLVIPCPATDDEGQHCLYLVNRDGTHKNGRADHSFVLTVTWVKWAFE